MRLIAALLLAGIAWTSTAEVTHRHGGGAAPTTATQTAQANFSSSQPSNASVQSGQPLRSSSRGNTASECLICQLHHNLATTLFSEPATLATPQTASAQEALPAHIDLFEVTAAHSGRAPPLSFLS